MCPNLSDDLEQIKDARKTAVIDCELSKLNVDIAALQETRLPSNGNLKEREYTFFWQGLEPSESCLYGVGFAVLNSILPSTEPPSQGSDRILSLRFISSSGPINILLIRCILNLSVASEQRGPPSTWFSPLGSYRRNAASRNTPIPRVHRIYQGL